MDLKSISSKSTVEASLQVFIEWRRKRFYTESSTKHFETDILSLIKFVNIRTDIAPLVEDLEDTGLVNAWLINQLESEVENPLIFRRVHSLFSLVNLLIRHGILMENVFGDLKLKLQLSGQFPKMLSYTEDFQSNKQKDEKNKCYIKGYGYLTPEQEDAFLYYLTN